MYYFNANASKLGGAVQFMRQWTMLMASEGAMQTRAYNRLLVPATMRWLRSRERSFCPQRHLHALPTLTRPSLFGGD